VETEVRRFEDEEVMEFDDEDEYADLKIENVDGAGDKRSKPKQDMNDPELLDELEEIFQSAHEQLMLSIAPS